MSKRVGIALFIFLFLSISLNLIGFLYLNNLTVDKGAIEFQYNNLLSQVQQLETNIINNEEDNQKLKEKLDYLQQISDINNLLIKEQISLLDLKEDNTFLSENSIIPIYMANIDNYNQEMTLYTSIPNNSTLEEKLNIICNKLSQYSFNGLPIELKEIKYIENKKIAVISLQESLINQERNSYENWIGKSWTSNYFQGSSGGMVTSIELIETFLQRKYEGDWIDGVKFLYKGSNIEFEHVPSLSDIIYR